MLAGKSPHSFLSGAKIDTSKVLKQGSKHEFHHIFPKKFLEGQGVEPRDINCLSNICFLTRSDNNTIKAKDPAVYFADMSDENRKKYLREALCKPSDKKLPFLEFAEARAERLSKLALKLANVPI